MLLPLLIGLYVVLHYMLPSIVGCPALNAVLVCTLSATLAHWYDLCHGCRSLLKMWQQSSSTVGLCHSQPRPATACQPSLTLPPAIRKPTMTTPSMRLGNSGDVCNLKAWSRCCSQPPAKAKAAFLLTTCLLRPLLPATPKGTSLLATCAFGGLLPVSPSHQSCPRVMLGLPAVVTQACLQPTAQLLPLSRRAASTLLLAGKRQWEAALCTLHCLWRQTAVVTQMLAARAPLILKMLLTATKANECWATSSRRLGVCLSKAHLLTSPSGEPPPLL